MPFQASFVTGHNTAFVCISPPFFVVSLLTLKQKKGLIDVFKRFKSFNLTLKARKRNKSPLYYFLTIKDYQKQTHI
jgi:hypothetical protein